MKYHRILYTINHILYTINDKRTGKEEVPEHCYRFLLAELFLILQLGEGR